MSKLINSQISYSYDLFEKIDKHIGVMFSDMQNNITMNFDLKYCEKILEEMSINKLTAFIEHLDDLKILSEKIYFKKR